MIILPTMRGVLSRKKKKRLWTPEKISTGAWFDASDSSTLYDATSGGSAVGSGGGVARWEDKSGADRHASQGTSDNRPLRIVAAQNGLDIVGFDGSNDNMQIQNALSVMRNIECGMIFAVVKTNSTSPSVDQTVIAWTRNGSNNQARIGLQLNTNGGANFRNVSRRTDADTASQAVSANNANFNVLAAESVYAANANRLWVNGVNTDTSTYSSGVGSTSDTDSNTAEIGSLGAGGTAFAPMDLCEVVCVNTSVNTETRQLMEGYLVHKWGLVDSLPGGHPYKEVNPYI